MQKLIQHLNDKKGLEKVHVADKTEDGVPQLCFHYNPELISINRIQTLAEQSGAEITQKFGHKLIEVDGIRHTRHARNIEHDLQGIEGILEISISASGMVRVEFDLTKLDEAAILKTLKNKGLDVLETHVSAELFLEKIEETKKGEDQKEDKKTTTMRKVKIMNTLTVVFSVKIRSSSFPLSVEHCSVLALDCLM